MIDPSRIQNSRILIVDDKESNVRLLEKVLEAENFRNYLSTTDSRAATDLYQAYQPDLLLLDLRMPHIDGFEVMEALREQSNDDYLPILVLTADLAQTTRIRALKAGAKDFLTKPFDQLEVITRIRNILEVRLLYNDLRDQNIILEQKVKERTEELRQTRLEIIHRLSRAAELHDQGTGMHLLRISQYSGCVARAAKLAGAEAELILSASPMHDVGKIGIPDSLLLKPGNLNEEEWVIMQTHTTIGHELLSGHDSAIMNMASSIALHHHERWDGTGYPQGLRGSDIPIEGRIVALCDVFDALISKRPYKDQWPLETAVREIHGLSGIAFDPQLVEAFGTALSEIKQVIRKTEIGTSVA